MGLKSATCMELMEAISKIIILSKTALKGILQMKQFYEMFVIVTGTNCCYKWKK